MQVRERLVELAAERIGGDQAELARRLGETWQWVHYRLNGTTAIKADEIPRFAEALGIHPWEFFEGAPSVRTTFPGDDLAEEFRAFIEKKVDRLPPHEQRAVYLAAGVVDTLLAQAG